MVEKEEIVSRFLELKEKSEIGKCLGGSFANLSYNLYKVKDEERYKVFTLKKKNGEDRIICAPSKRLKYYQRNLANILQTLYKRKSCVYGFVKGCNIVDNAKVHSGRKIVVNIDLEDFFPSIHFGRVYGMFKAKPFEFSESVAVTLAQLCCHNGSLPQGAPTSPVISNLICRSLDNELLKFASSHKLFYSRYADDITFSTSLNELPEDLGTIGQNKELTLSDGFVEIIERNGFKINQNKTRYSRRQGRQEVTGLTVNKFPNVRRTYIRNVRAMLHAMKKFGLEAAAKEHFKNSPDHGGSNPVDRLKNELSGRLGFIRYVRSKRLEDNIDDNLYWTLYLNAYELDKDLHLPVPKNITIPPSTKAIVRCEGKTDGKHLMAALKQLMKFDEIPNPHLFIYLYTESQQINNDKLLKHCEISSRKTHTFKHIYIFDCDVKDIIKKVTEDGKPYKDWGNNVYSCILPQPKHRNFKELCIEHFYEDNDLKKADKRDRRIYLSDEFDKDGKHKKQELHLRKKTLVESSYPRIIDDGVFKRNGDNVALNKNAFAEHIFWGEPPFDKMNFEHFKDILTLLSDIADLEPKSQG